MAIIKTPDQRVRVFISSTINELADERKAAREAINNLRLIPVFFEAGARPHPPRDLYSAYLEQSHIFLGIYWNSYGWVAPGAEISGLEDEYRLCGKTKPKLIYVKKSDERQPQLNQLLADIEKSETACYQFFSDAAELQKLIENDLSVLMSEIFENAVFTQQQTIETSNQPLEIKHHKLVELPLIKSEIYGREEDLNDVAKLLGKPDVSLVTLLGAGGTGKTTLSIHIAHKVKEQFKDGVAFIPLAPVTDFKLTGATIAEILGVQDSGKQPIEQTLIDFLSDKNFLLVLDNFEQIIDASKFVSDIITRCKDVKILVTSRTSLHVRNERIYNLAPLALPDEDKKITPEELRNFPATQLFVERALEVNPRLQFTKENTDAIIEICQRMDGLPLAIELAAARTRFFQPAALMSRIEKTLDLVSKGHKDLPERQQTLRGAIEWSYNLLTEDTQKVFRQLGAFKRSWTMEAADAIINDNSVDIEEMTERLLDVSLIKPVLVNHSAEPRFNMLQTVHEYAAEMLEKSAEATETKMRYADYFFQLCEQSEGHTWGVNSEPWFDKFEFEFQNIRAAFYIFVENKNYEKAWKLFYLLVPYWHMRTGLSEAATWIQVAKIDSKIDTTDKDLSQISTEVKGKTFLWAAYVQFFLLKIESGYVFVYRAEELLRQTNDVSSLVSALAMDGGYGVYMKLPDAVEKINEAEKLAEQTNDLFAKSSIYLWTVQYYYESGEIEKGKKNLEYATRLAIDNDVKYAFGLLFIIQSGFLTMERKYDEAIQYSLETYKLLPEKGYKSYKSACMGQLAISYLMMDKIPEAEQYYLKSLELTRECGEKEGEFHSTLLGSYLNEKKGDSEKACKLFGALNAFIEFSKYPMISVTKEYYDMTKALVFPDESNVQRKKWYDEGKKIKIEEAVIYAMKKN